MDNVYGQLGDGATVFSSTPVLVGNAGVTGIGAGD